MMGLTNVDYVLLVLTSSLLAALLAILFLRRNYKVFPWFTIYLFLNVVQSAGMQVIVHYKDYSSNFSRWAYWMTQGLVVVARFLAVVELCRRLLRGYAGIWGLSWRFLTACSVTIFFYAVISAGRNLPTAILRLDRGLEFAIALTVVGFVSFMRYYRVPIEPAERMLAMGFCLLSCTWVADNTVFEVFSNSYLVYWRYLEQIAAVGTLLLWTWALRYELAPALRRSDMLEVRVYQELSPEINLRLRHLNEQLLALWKPEVRES